MTPSEGHGVGSFAGLGPPIVLTQISLAQGQRHPAHTQFRHCH